MKIIIFGASGSIGKPLVMQALGLDHQVTAFVRSEHGAMAEFSHPNLHVVKGNVFHLESVTEAIRGQDAVFCVLGDGRKGEVRTRGTKNIIDAMESLQVKRLICQSTLGAGDSVNNLNFFWKHIMFGWFLKQAFEDHQRQELLVKNSRLDWTIVRPAAFTNGPATGVFKHGFTSSDTSLKLKISRADVALFLLMQLQSTDYLRKTPGLSY